MGSVSNTKHPVFNLFLIFTRRAFHAPTFLYSFIMYSKIISTTVLFGTAFAGFQDMKDQLNELTNRYIRGLIEANRPQPRAISDVLTGDNFDKINEYGCWCYFEDDHGRGHGKPINGIDHICKKLADGYDCCMLDNEELTGNDSCVPWEVRYLPGSGTGESNLVFNCDGFNPVDPVTHDGFCRNCACKVEGLFVTRVFNLFMPVVLLTINTPKLTDSTKKSIAHFKTELKTLNELAVENIHTDFLTNLCLENDLVAVV